MMPKKKLMRNMNDRAIAGVASGLADYFEIDKTLVRAAFVVLPLCGFGGVAVAYPVLWLMMPASPQEQSLHSPMAYA